MDFLLAGFLVHCTSLCLLCILSCHRLLLMPFFHSFNISYAFCGAQLSRGPAQHPAAVDIPWVL
jgi:hypothetical protein